MSSLASKRKRLAFRLAGFAAGIGVLAVVYQLTRPPELVWWRSPAIGSSGRHVRVLVPRGWSLNLPADIEEEDGDWSASWVLTNVDKTPPFIQRFFRLPAEKYASLLISPALHRNKLDDRDNNPPGIRLDSWSLGEHCAEREVIQRDMRIRVELDYQRDDASSFNRTYKQICNSLKIE